MMWIYSKPVLQSNQPSAHKFPGGVRIARVCLRRITASDSLSARAITAENLPSTTQLHSSPLVTLCHLELLSSLSSIHLSIFLPAYLVQGRDGPGALEVLGMRKGMLWRGCQSVVGHTLWAILWAIYGDCYTWEHTVPPRVLEKLKTWTFLYAFSSHGKVTGKNSLSLRKKWAVLRFYMHVKIIM